MGEPVPLESAPAESTARDPAVSSTATTRQDLPPHAVRRKSIVAATSVFVAESIRNGIVTKFEESVPGLKEARVKVSCSSWLNQEQGSNCPRSFHSAEDLGMH